MQPPKAIQENKSLVKHSDTRIDPFYWMNQRDSPQVIDYLNQENEYAKSWFTPYKNLEDEIYQEIVSRISPNEEAAPWFENGYWYFKKYKDGSEYPQYYRSFNLDSANPQLILDIELLAKDKVYFHLGSFSISPNNQYLAYSCDTLSRRIYNICIIDLHNGSVVAEISNSCGVEMEWSADSQFLFYISKDDSLREFKVIRHKLHSSLASDQLVYEENNDSYYVSIHLSKSRKYILIESISSVQSAVRVLPSLAPESEPELFTESIDNIEYYVDHLVDDWYIRTNWNAPNFVIMKTLENRTSMKYWEILLSHSPHIYIEDFELFSSRLVVLERSSGLQRLKVLEFSDDSYYIPFNESAYVIEFYKNKNPDSDSIYFQYSTPITAKIVYRFHFINKQRFNFWKQILPGDFQSEHYQVLRLDVMSHDSKLIPLTLIFSKNHPPSEQSPLLLYGYGSYGISIDPGFSVARLSLLDRGFVVAIAHVRGGQELGREWYEGGKLLSKKNTFYDFISCAQFVIQEKLASANKLFAYGGSAGGMLMGYILNEFPQLWKGVIAVVPFVDVLTTMLDESIPLTTGEYDEWGNPNDPIYYRYMKSYSPYDNVKNQLYPNIYIRTGYHDSQVQYWEPSKWVAKLRLNQMGSNEILFECDMDTGHGGSSGRFKPFRESARDYVFLLGVLLKE
ncbi:MAG: S9 family peptidase [Saprospiraceae bacterium]|nr:S9 family peptidase [Saprospiraceae bacterium]